MPLPIDDGQNDRDKREQFDLIGLHSHRKVNNPEPKKPGMKWYEFLFYTALLIGLWIFGQFTPGIPDETFGNIIVLAIALIRQNAILTKR